MSSPTSMRHAARPLREASLALAGLSAVFAFEMLDNSILNIALPTIGRELAASASQLQWVTSAYALVFGGLMLLCGAIADRFGRRRVMLLGLVLLVVASGATVLVRTPAELIAVRTAMGVAAAMTTPGSVALAFRLFAEDGLRVKAMTLISTVGLVGLAVGPTVGGLVLAIAPWQALLVANAPVALLAFVGIRLGIPADDPADAHRGPLDVVGGVLGTAAIVSALVAPTLFVEKGTDSWMPWAATAGAAMLVVAFIQRERAAQNPILDLRLVGLPLVSSGLLHKAAAGVATAGMGYLVSLQLQLAWGWPPALAALGMLPQVIVLIAGGAVITPLLNRIGFEAAALSGAISVVVGLAIYTLLSSRGYGWVAISLVLVAAGLRVVGVVAGTNVMRGLPENRTTMGAAIADTATQIANGVGLAVAGSVLAALFAGTLSESTFTPAQSTVFEQAVLVGGGALTLIAAALTAWGFVRSRIGGSPADRLAVQYQRERT